MRTEGPPGVISLGPATSVQVNVNATGNNILGDAANEPSIAIDRNNPNRIAIGWRQFDDVTNNFRQAGHAYSTDGGQTWTFPGVLDPGQFRSDPVLDSNAAGNFYYSSLSSLSSAEVFKSVDGGINWGLDVPAFGGDKQWLAVDDRPSGVGAGLIYQNWNVQFSCCPPNDFTRSIDGAASFQAPIAIPPPSMKWGTNDVGSDGTLYLAGSTLDQDGHLVARSSNAHFPLSTPSFDFVNIVNLGGLTGGFGGGDDPNPGGLLGQVWIAADPSNVKRVYILASVVPPSGNPVDVMFIRSVDKAGNFSSPVRVNDDPASGAFHWFGTMSVAPNGRIDVVWNDSRNSGIGYISQLFYSYSVDTGLTWSPNVALSPAWNSHEGWPNQNKIGDYYHMISDNGGASLAYAATFNFNSGRGEHEQDVYFLRIIADCNNNGTPDDQDVINGAPDCNQNLIPDICEPQADCNGNLLQDICDIFSGFSTDCNLNLVPDSCESQMDCNNNGQPDFCDIAAGAPDCNRNGVPDSCDISGGSSLDTNGDQIPDECEGACCQCNGSCSLTTSSGCTAQSGLFNGTGSSCGSVVCGTTPNDDCVDRFTLPRDSVVTVPFNNQCATLDGPSPIDCDVPAEPFGADLWYDYVAPCDGLIRVSLCGPTDFDTMLAVYGGSSTCACPSAGAPQLACGDDSCGIGSGPSEVFVNVTADRCYTIRVGGWQTETGSGQMSITYETVCNFVKLDQPPDSTGEDIASNIDRTDMAPNSVVADDFVSDGRPITAVRWWGSNLPTASVARADDPPRPGQASWHRGDDRNVGSTGDPQFTHFPAGSVVTAVPGCLMVNGDFETGTLAGWSTATSGNGSWVINDGVFDPDSPDGPLPPCAGSFSAMTDPVGPGVRTLYQDVTIPAAGSVRLTWIDMMRNHGGGYVDPGQEFRVLVRNPVDNSLLATLYSTNPGDALFQVCTPRCADLSAFAGQTIRLAFEEEDSLFYFNAHVDDVCVDLNTTCPTTGACCVAGYCLQNQTSTDCSLQGGIYQGDGTTVCANCSPSTGACCLAGPNCLQNQTSTDCSLQGGIYQGDGTTVCTDCPSGGGCPGAGDCCAAHGNAGCENISCCQAVCAGDPYCCDVEWDSICASEALQICGPAACSRSIDGWLISFHKPLETGGPPSPPLALYFCDASVVGVTPTALAACDAHPVQQYEASLVNCCLVHTFADSRSGLTPGQADAFHEQLCFAYDIDIQAVVGRTYTGANGSCTGEVTTGRSATADIWGWHSTSVEHGLEPGVETAVSMVGSDWLYGPWDLLTPTCSEPNMAFQLLTSVFVGGDDDNGNGIPDECEGPPPNEIVWRPYGRCTLAPFAPCTVDADCGPTAPCDLWPNDDPKATTRSLRFEVMSAQTATATPGQSAIKVTMVDLMHPNPRNLPQYVPPSYATFDTGTHGTCAGATTGPNFNGHHCSSDADCLGPNGAITTDDGTCTLPGPSCTAIGETNPPTANGIGGCARWVGMPGTFYESQGPPLAGPYRASRLQCSPFYWDWASEPGGEVIVVGAEILPSSEFSVQDFAASCKGVEDGCPNVSAPVSMFTRRKGDLDLPYQSPSPAALTQADVLDVSQAVASVKHVAGAPAHIRAQMQPNAPELNADPNVLDIVEAVDSVKRIAYSFSGPCVCPSTQTCGLSCTGCAGLCLKTCVGGGNAGQTCINNIHCPGTCVGGTNPGAVCPSGVPGGVNCAGVCVGGTNPGAACTSPGSQCLGGGTCSASCSGLCSATGTCYDKCGRCSP